MSTTTAPPRPGLRLRKKTETRAALLAEAKRLVRASGVAALRVPDIADSAGVSEASFYNYFGSRDALLSEWAHQSLSQALAAGRAAKGGSLRGRLRGPLREYARRCSDEAELMGELWRRAALLPDRDAPGASSAGHDALSAAVQAAQASGELRADIPAGELAEALRTSAAVAVARVLGRGGDAGATLAPALLRAVDLVLDGARKRNERVRPGRQPSRSAPP